MGTDEDTKLLGLMEALIGRASEGVLLGDFKLPNVHWTKGSAASGTAGQAVLPRLLLHELTQRVGPDIRLRLRRCPLLPDLVIEGVEEM